jgi:predicted flap endonuclease-1-like 5' DNA nuclease
MTRRSNTADLQQAPGIGPSLAQDLRDLGVGPTPNACISG